MNHLYIQFMRKARAAQIGSLVFSGGLCRSTFSLGSRILAGKFRFSSIEPKVLSEHRASTHLD